MIKTEKELLKTLSCDELCFIKTKRKNQDIDEELHSKECEC